MFEVHPDDKGKWILYEVGGGDFSVVAWFVDKADAEFAKMAFERRNEMGRPQNGLNGHHAPKATEVAQ
jgi:hypothetical protein